MTSGGWLGRAGTTLDCSCRMTSVDPDPSQEKVYIALGSNLGDRDAHLAAALDGLRDSAGIDLVRVSPVFETDPVGPPPQGPYLNAVAQLRSRLDPRGLLARMLEIEALRGRTRSGSRDSARCLDLDLLLFGDRIIAEPGLEIPHPRLHTRAFVLEPLRALAANAVHPVLGESIETLAKRVYNPDAVRLRIG
jgi:2-amino-4-hydroxy-6-hydroxymethyldihydropteridine diphosphokinase